MQSLSAHTALSELVPAARGDSEARLTDLTNAAPAPTDARPALPVSEESLWDKAAEKRDQIAAQIGVEFVKENIVAWVRKSKPGEYPLYVEVKSWQPVAETKLAATVDRSSFRITISVEPYRENPLIYKVELNRHGRKLCDQHWVLSSTDVAELTGYLLKGGRKPDFYRPRVPAWKRFIGTFIPFVGNPPQNKVIAEARPNHFTLANVVGWGGAALIIVFGAQAVSELTSYYPDDVGVYIVGALAGVAAVITAAIMARRRPKLDALPKQSTRTPRREFLVDSWHVSVPGAGEQFEQFRDRLYKAVTARDPAIEVNFELHQNSTPRGFEERERLVLTKGQSTLHIHVYPFSNDAFVGWESYLNWNRWAETAPVSTTVRDGQRVEYRSLEVGVHVPTDFDLIEADTLTETTHRMLVDEIKAFLKEREIEADLDFKIIRGDRAKALTEGKDQKKT